MDGILTWDCSRGGGGGGDDLRLTAVFSDLTGLDDDDDSDEDVDEDFTLTSFVFKFSAASYFSIFCCCKI